MIDDASQRTPDLQRSCPALDHNQELLPSPFPSLLLIFPLSAFSFTFYLKQPQNILKILSDVGWALCTDDLIWPQPGRLPPLRFLNQIFILNWKLVFKVPYPASSDSGRTVWGKTDFTLVFRSDRGSFGPLACTQA